MSRRSRLALAALAVLALAMLTLSVLRFRKSLD